MVPKLFVLCFIFLITNGEEVKKEDIKRDKRTVGVLLRGVADVFGYDVIRRVTSPQLRQVASPRPTFFPPPVAPLPPGSYSRIILQLGQQQQQQRQQQEQQALFGPQDVVGTQQPQALISSNQGSISASGQSLTLPQGAFLLPVAHPLLIGQQSVQPSAQPNAQQNAPPAQPAAPSPSAAPAPTQPPAPQVTPQAARQSAPAPNPPAPSPTQAQNLLPFHIVALAPVLAQQNAPAQPSEPPRPIETSPLPQPTPAANAAQQNPQGVNIVFDSGPTRLNLFGTPRAEAIRRTLNFNLNWNREPITLAVQNQPLQVNTPPPSPAPAQSAALVNQPAQQQQQLPSPSPTPENFEILPAQKNNQFNRFYNVPNDFQNDNKKAPQKDYNEQFRNSVRQFWQSSPWNKKNEIRRADTKEELRKEDVQAENIQREEVNEQAPPQARYEEYESRSDAEEHHSPGDENESYEEASKVNDDNQENSNEDTDESKESARVRFKYDNNNEESNYLPAYRRRSGMLRRMRKVKKSIDSSDQGHGVVKREENSKLTPQEEETEVKNYYKKFMTVRQTRSVESQYQPIGAYSKDSYNTDFSYTVPETKIDYSALESKIFDTAVEFPKKSEVYSHESKTGLNIVKLSKDTKFT